MEMGDGTARLKSLIAALCVAGCEMGEVLNEVSIINMSQCVWPDVYQQGVVRYIKPTALQIAPQLTLPPVWSSVLSPVKFVIRVFMLYN